MRQAVLLLCIAVNALPALVSAEEQQGEFGFCCGPDRWESQADVLLSMSAARRRFIARARMQISYDYINQMVTTTVISPRRTSRSTNSRIKVIVNGAQRKMYTINLSNGSCKVSPISEPIQRTCIPSTFSYNGTYRLGVPSIETLSYRQYRGKLPNGMTTTAAVTNRACAPLWARIQWPGKAGLVYTSFYNYQLGISDASVFRVPVQCLGRFGYEEGPQDVALNWDSDVPDEVGEVEDLREAAMQTVYNWMLGL